jgi:hypothetical protein
MRTSNLTIKYDNLATDTLHNGGYHDVDQEVGSSGSTSGFYSGAAQFTFQQRE